MITPVVREFSKKKVPQEKKKKKEDGERRPFQPKKDSRSCARWGTSGTWQEFHTHNHPLVGHNGAKKNGHGEGDII